MLTSCLLPGSTGTGHLMLLLPGPPHHDELDPRIVSQNKNRSFVPLLLGYFITATGKVTDLKRTNKQSCLQLMCLGKGSNRDKFPVVQH